MAVSIQFLGGAGTVTGSKFLVSADGKRVLVDCGLFQGIKELRLKNWEQLPVDPQTVDAVLLTHAHLDHCGYLPLLVRNGFAGPIYCTAPTRALSKVILNDSAKIQIEDANRANLEGFSRHSPAKPLYTLEDVTRTLGLMKSVPTHEWTPIASPFSARFTSSGHILGSALIELKTPETTIAFTGDLGRSEPLILRPPEFIREAHVLVMESTYGDRQHSPMSPLRELARIVNETFEHKGHVIIPAFAIGRTQDLLYLLSTLLLTSQIPDIPIFLDSPMGVNATDIFLDYPEWHGLTVEEVHRISKCVTLVKSYQQSEELLHRKHSAIVIAGSGMITGGRVLSHLMTRLPDPRNAVVLTGFQAPGTRGSLLRSGASELKIYGSYVPVRARVEDISTLSAHADQGDLLRWMEHFEKGPEKVFLIHGEPQASDALRVRIADRFGWDCVIPKQGESFDLSRQSPGE